MKSLKIFFTLALIASSVLGALAFTSAKENGIYRCRLDTTSGACPTSTARYSVVSPEEPGTNRRCNDGTENDLTCDNSILRVAQDDK